MGSPPPGTQNGRAMMATLGRGGGSARSADIDHRSHETGEPAGGVFTRGGCIHCDGLLVSLHPNYVQLIYLNDIIEVYHNL